MSALVYGQPWPITSPSGSEVGQYVAAALGGATISVVPPASGDAAASIQAAMNSLAATGGIVQLGAGTYNITSASLLPVAGVTLKGVGWAISNTQGSTAPVAGTILSGNGTIRCIAYNATDGGLAWGSTQPSQAQIFANKVDGFTISDLAITGFTDGVKIGARYVPGVFNGQLKNIYITSCSGWGVYLENCHELRYDTVKVTGLSLGAIGGIMISANVTAYNVGNSKGDYLFSQPNQPLTRGIVFRARDGATTNDLGFQHLQNNSGTSAVTTQAATLLSGSNIISVPTASSYPLDCPVFFDTNAGNVAKFQTLFVVANTTSVTATAAIPNAATSATLSANWSGPTSANYSLTFSDGEVRTGVTLTNGSTAVSWTGGITAGGGVTASITVGNLLQLSLYQGGTTIFTPTTSAAMNLLTFGFPQLELVGTGDTSHGTIQSSSFSTIDGEGRATCQILVQNAQVDLQIGTLDSNQGLTSSNRNASSICCRNPLGGSVRNNGAAMSYDTDQVNAPFFALGATFNNGTDPVPYLLGNNPMGLYKDVGAGNVLLNLGQIHSRIQVAGGSDPVIQTLNSIAAGGGSSAGTLTNAPAAGNPTAWIQINDNGTIRKFPAW